MAQPTIKLLYNSTVNDIPYNQGAGGNPDSSFDLVTSSGTIVFTGGGIDDVATFSGSGPYPSGTRAATIKPEVGTLPIPKTLIEVGDWMYQVPLAGLNGNSYVFAVYVGGETTSNVYLEAWDDQNHITCSGTPVLSGTLSNGYVSMIKARTTTSGLGSWTPIRGYGSRLDLSNSINGVTDTTLYFNVYVELPHDTVTFVNTPVLSLRYLYS